MNHYRIVSTGATRATTHSTPEAAWDSWARLHGVSGSAEYLFGAECAARSARLIVAPSRRIALAADVSVGVSDYRAAPSRGHAARRDGGVR
jgi:hypothetical protein